jgi:Uncharacterized protein conserved in bacteria
MKLTLQALSMSLHETAEYLQDLAKDVANLPELGQGVNNVRLTANFNLREFQCPCCGAVKIDPELVRRLQVARDRIGKPIIVTSGYRCPDHNRRVGGASNSQHLHGRAADIYCQGVTVAQLADIAEGYFQDGGLGRYAGHVHVDIRGTKARWTG